MLKKIKNITCSVCNIIGDFRPSVGVVIGSGLSSFAQEVEVLYRIKYQDIEGFPLSTVEGHMGELIFGRIASKNVIIQNGRFHYYEGYTPEEVVVCIQLMKELGVDTLLLSNSAGAINQGFNVGDIMLITDHINFIPNPLIGRNDSELGERFPSMNNAYDRELREKAWQSGMFFRCGVYAGMSGPSYETLAEINFLRIIGADAVGMSTVPEVIAARYLGMRVFAVSVITNICGSVTPPSHQEVLDAGDKAAENLKQIFNYILEEN